MCMCVILFVCTCVCVRVCVCVCVCACPCPCLSVRVYVHVCASVYVRVHAYARVCAHARLCVCACLQILHSVGNEYMSRLATVEDLDSIIECFDSFVNLVLDRCLLGPEVGGSHGYDSLSCCRKFTFIPSVAQICERLTIHRVAVGNMRNISGQFLAMAHLKGPGLSNRQGPFRSFA